MFLVIRTELLPILFSYSVLNSNMGWRHVVTMAIIG